MSWVSGGDDSKDEDPFPVDSLVRDVLVDLKQVNGACTHYGGNEWKCCNRMAACLVNFKKKMESIQAQEVDDQNMHRACRHADEAWKTAKKCLSDIVCQRNVIEEELLGPFDNALAAAHTTQRKHCKDLPEEKTTTTKATTTRASTSTTRPSTTTPLPPTTTPTTTTSPPTTTTTTPTTTTFPPTTTTTTPTTTTSPPTTTTTRPTTQVPTHEPVTSSSTSTTSTTTTTPKPPTTSPNPPYSSTTLQDPNSNTTFDSTPGTPTEPPHSGSTKPTGDNGNPTVSDNITDSQTTSNFTGDNVTPVVMTESTPVTGTRNQSIGGNEGMTSHPDNLDNVLIACSVLGAFLLIIGVVVFFIIKWRKYQASQEGSNGSTSSKAPFIWRWLSTKSTTKTDDTDIYAEIDEAFMEAVYHVDQKKPSKTKRQQSNSQINICYETGLEDGDAIITGKKSGPARSKPTSISEVPEEAQKLEHGDKEVIHDFHNRLDISREKETHGGFNTSFQDKKDDKRDHFKASKAKPFEGHILSRPAFTDINYESDRYEEITPHEDEYVEINEPVYEVPLEVQHTYDTTNFGNFRRNKNQPEPNYSHIHVYKNDISRKRNKSDKNSDEKFYENNDSMMEY